MADLQRYIDRTAPPGGNGLTPATAWQNPSNIVWTPDTDYNFIPNAAWDESLTLGAPGSRCRSAVRAVRAIIDLAGANAIGIDFNDQDDCEVDGFHVRNTGNHGIQMGDVTASMPNRAIVRRCLVELAGSAAGDPSGIKMKSHDARVYDTVVANPYQDCFNHPNGSALIRGCKGYGMGQNPAQGDFLQSGSAANSGSLTIERTVIHKRNPVKHGILWHGAVGSNLTVRECQFVWEGAAAQRNACTVGAADNVYMYDNDFLGDWYIALMVLATGGSVRGVTESIVFERNRIEGMERSFQQRENATCSVYVRRNVFSGGGRAAGTRGPDIQHGGPREITDNVFDRMERFLTIETGNPPNTLIDRNRYHSDTGANWRAPTATNWTEWQALGHDPNGEERAVGAPIEVPERFGASIGALGDAFYESLYARTGMRTTREAAWRRWLTTAMAGDLDYVGDALMDLATPVGTSHPDAMLALMGASTGRISRNDAARYWTLTRVRNPELATSREAGVAPDGWTDLHDTGSKEYVQERGYRKFRAFGTTGQRATLERRLSVTVGQRYTLGIYVHDITEWNERKVWIPSSEGTWISGPSNTAAGEWAWYVFEMLVALPRVRIGYGPSTTPAADGDITLSSFTVVPGEHAIAA